MSKLLPASTGVYRIIKSDELTVEQLAVLRAAKREHVHARLCALVVQGRIAIEQALDVYEQLADRAKGEG